MIFDTDVLIFAQKGNIKAAELINETEERKISIITYIELLQGAFNSNHHQIIRKFLKYYDFKILNINEAIGHRASIYIEAYSLSNSMVLADSLIAATAIENNDTLCTANIKHFKFIPDIRITQFNP
ncbi:MAG: type II toxin-antitoxin system VapC family toxin [Lentisphaerota bacterium]